MRRGQPQIEVTFDIDANGILNVTAEEKSTGKKQEVKIQGSTNLSDEEITKAKAEAEKFAEEDKNRRENVESKNRMEALLYQMENLIAEKKDTIPDADKEIVNKLVADGKALKDKEDVTKEEIDEEIKTILENSEKEALRILQENRDKLEKLANTLLEKETLTGNEIDEILKEKNG